MNFQMCLAIDISVIKIRILKIIMFGNEYRWIKYIKYNNLRKIVEEIYQQKWSLMSQW